MKNFNILFLLFMFFAMFNNSSSLAQSLIKISDSSQINNTKINKLTAIVEDSKIPLGTMILWRKQFGYAPKDNGCTNAYSGGDGKSGTCKWLICNGQYLNPEIYPEYVKLFGDRTQSLHIGRIFYQKKNFDKNDPYPNNLYVSMNVEMDLTNTSLTNDGMTGLRLGDNHDYTYIDSVGGYNTHTTSSNMNSYNLSDKNYIGKEYLQYYLVRVSN